MGVLALTLLLAVTGRSVEASSVAISNHTRKIEAEASVSDVRGENTFLDRDTSARKRGRFDETARVDGDSPTGAASASARAVQNSRLQTVGDHFSLSATMNTNTRIEAADAQDAQLSFPAATSGLDLTLTLDAPMSVRISGQWRRAGIQPWTTIRGLESIGLDPLDDFGSFASGGADDFLATGMLPAGTHEIDAEALASTTTGEPMSGESARMRFTMTGRVVPMPAALGPGLMLLGALALRRGRGGARFAAH